MCDRKFNLLTSAAASVLMHSILNSDSSNYKMANKKSVKQLAENA